ASPSLAACQQRPADTNALRADQSAPSVAATTTPSMTAPSTTTPTAVDKAVTATDDAAITAKVKTAILAEPGLKSLQINVDTKDATVTLSGNVDSDMLRDRAKQIAMSTEGVKNVVDNLSVKTG